ncbi:MAG: GTPase [Deltaproteobacteria bacterium]|nr:GTPase [Deltaproteobacteria bacterium]
MASDSPKSRVVILGAAGRDFHDFNVQYRHDPTVTVVAFTAAQIPGIDARRYPPSLAGPLYPDGVAIEPEDRLEAICARENVTQVVFAYSDVSHAHVMHLASRSLAAGADFLLLGPRSTMIESPIPVIAICATRTGCGKSQIARWLGRRLREQGVRVAVLRHPMPYGDLERQRAQCFAAREDLARADCTLEEREEYEPHLAAGNVVFAGVDYAEIVRQAARRAELIVWDGGNNDFPFVRPDLAVAVVDALRPGQADAYHPGETVLRMAGVVVVNKVDAASSADVLRVIDEVRAVNPGAILVHAASPVRLDDPPAVRGRRVLVVEDGPTITHGGMAHGAGFVAAVRAGAATIVDPRASAAGAIREIFTRYPHIGRVLPAVGYGPEQLSALRATIDGSDAEVVVSATPIDLAATIALEKPVVRARYEFAEAGEPTLGAVIDGFRERLGDRLGRRP